MQKNINLASPKQLGEILFDDLKIESNPKKTKTGQYSTSEETLSKLSKKHEIVTKILSGGHCKINVNIHKRSSRTSGYKTKKFIQYLIKPIHQQAD